MSEMALTADHLIVIGRGRLIADVGVDEFIRRHSKSLVLVRSPQVTALAELLAGPNVSITPVEDEGLEVEGLTAEQIGSEAAANRIVLHELAPRQASLEEAFMLLTRDELEYQIHSSSLNTTDHEGALAA
jgi:ABC-2 type transport system ATP-binding protein